MRWKMKASKGRFALAVLSAAVTCFTAGISAATTSLPNLIVSLVVSKIFQEEWYVPNPIPTPSVIVVVLTLLLTVLFTVLIFRFGTATIGAWNAPARISDAYLKEKCRENDMMALAFEQIRLLMKRQKDRLASETAMNWQDSVDDPPEPADAKDLLRNMLVSAISEIRISKDGWRDDGNYWVGKKEGPLPEDSRSIIAFVYKAKPTQEDLESRIGILMEESEALKKAKFYAIYLSKVADRSNCKPIKTSFTEVSVLSSRELILMGLDLRSYAQKLIDTFEGTRVGGTKATLKGSFVELKATNSSNYRNPDDLSKQLHDWLSRDSGEHIALTGEYGQGKSTALLKFCYDWAKRFIESGVVGERVPLLIELRGQSPSETDPLGFISPWCARYRLSPQQVLNLIKAGDAVIIFEGFDELRNASRAYFRHQHFNALWRFAYPGTKLVFTGRPNFFLDQKEANQTLRSQETRKVVGGSFTSIWRLQKLDPSQIRESCRDYDKKVKEGITTAIEQHPEFLDIVSRPSMLPVVATIWGDIQKLNEAGEPLTGATLIEKYVQAVFSRKEAELETDRVRHNAPMGSRYLILPKLVREMLTLCVAWRMSGLKAKNTIKRDQIVEMVRDLYDPLFAISKSEGLEASIAEGLTNFEKQFLDQRPAEKIDAIAAEICSAGLLVPDPAGGSTNLRFPHKQFFEFLIAKGIAISTSEPALLATDLLNRASNTSNVIVRLRSEPNAVTFLAQTIGPNLNRILDFSERLYLKFFCTNYIFSEWILSWFRKEKKESCSNPSEDDIFYTKEKFETPDDMNEWNLSDKSLAELQRNVFFRGQVSLIFFSFASVSFYFFTYFAFFGAIIGRVSWPETADFVSISTLPILEIGMVLTAWGAASYFSIAKISLKSYLVQFGFFFLKEFLRRENRCPSSRLENVRLIRKSIVNEKVEFNDSIVCSSNFDQFLHPAVDFGEVGKNVKR